MLSDFFRINLPYGIRGNKTKGWFAFNREYKPIGFNKCGFDDIIKYENYPIFTKYKGLTETKLKKLDINFNSEELRHVGDKGEDVIIYLYDDATNPMNNKSVKYWDNYFKKLEILSKLKRISRE